MCEDLQTTGCTTPCDKYRSVDPLFLRENGTCECKPNANGAQCAQCDANFYFNTTTLTCTKCPQCYNVLSEKLINLNDNLQKITGMIDDYLNNVTQSKHEYKFLVKLKTVENNICGMLGSLMKKPQIQYIVKLNHLETILDITEKAISDIAMYLNGHINYKYFENELKRLERLISDISKKIKSSEFGPDPNQEKLENFVEDSDAEVEKIEKIVDDNEKLRAEVDQNSTEAKKTLENFKQKQSGGLEGHNFGNLTSAKEILDKAAKYLTETRRNHKTAKDYLDEAKKLKLPEWIEHQEEEVDPMLNGNFDDLSKKIEQAKKKFDKINEFLNALNKTEAVNDTKINDYLSNNKTGLFSKVETIQSDLTDTLDELQAVRSDLNEEMNEIDKNITKLNSDIDKEHQRLKDIQTCIEEQKQHITDHDKQNGGLKADEDKLNNLLKQLKKFKKQRKQFRQSVKDMNELLAKKRKIIALIDEANKIIDEFKTYIQNYNDLIAMMEELIKYLELIPIDELDEIERLIQSYEEYFHNIEILINEKKMLEKEMDKLSIYFSSLPDGTFIECEKNITYT